MRLAHLSPLLGLLLIVLPGTNLHPCTTAVVSGSATPDGRPLLWKNRDTPSRENEIIYSNKPGSFAFVGVINKGAGDTSSVWMGVNEHGFCIENSVSSDQERSGYSGPGNGTTMRLALEQCRSVAEFEQFLISTNGKRTTAANFGVIDAQGGAAIFETSPIGFTKFDANDPTVAPQGFVARSNFSFTGQNLPLNASDATLANTSSGGRYLRARNLLTAAANSGNGITHEYILQHMARDMADDNQNAVPGTINDPAGVLPEFINTAATIGRGSTASAAVFRGVRPGEDARLTTMWTLLGQPNFVLAVPAWPAVTSTSTLLRGAQGSQLCSLSLDLRKRNFVSGTVLRSQFLPAVWEHNLPWEQAMFSTVEAAMESWRSNGFTRAAVTTLHNNVTTDAYNHLLQLEQSIDWPEPAEAPPLFHYWDFAEVAGTTFDNTYNHISPATVWSGTIASSTSTGDGVFRIRRNSSGLNRRAELGDAYIADPVYLVAEIEGWNLTGTTGATYGEPIIYFRFMNGLAADLPTGITAGMTLERQPNGQVALTARAGGTGGQSSDPVALFGPVLNERLTLVTVFSESAEEYSVFYRLGNGPWVEFFTGSTAQDRNAISLLMYNRGDFNAGGVRFLDLNRIYVSSVHPDDVKFPGRVNHSRTVLAPSGPRSNWDHTDATLDIGAGAGATGALTVPAGQQVLFGNLNLGAGAANARGTLTVTGAGAVVESSVDGMATGDSDVKVGDLGTGTLLITNGATLVRRTLHVAVQSGSTGTITVAGSNSRMTSAGNWTLRVGQLGTGTLNVLDGAVVDGINNLFVGNVNNGGGTDVFTRAGTGSVFISGGSRLTTASSGRIGNRPGTTGLVSVSGVGSLFEMGSFLHVGSGGNGTLEVLNGATAVVDGVLSIGAGMRDFEEGTTGLVRVAGMGSSLSSSDTLHIGQAGQGTLLVETGGSLHTAGTLSLGSETPGAGSATVRGATSFVQVGQSIHVGSAGSGTLTLEGGAQVQADGDVGIHGASTLKVDAGTLVAGGVFQATDPASTVSIVLRGPGQAGIRSGGVNLAGANLQLALAYQPAAGDTIVLIANEGASPTIGQFSYHGEPLPDGAPLTVTTGGYSASFTIRYNGGESGRDVILAPPAGSVAFSSWMAGFTELSAEERDPLANPAGDGIVNALKFVLGIDPRESSCHCLPTPRVESTPEGDYMVLEFTLNPDALAVPGLVVQPQRSASLMGSWQAVSAEHIENLPSPAIRVRVPMTAGDPLFLRLKVDGLDSL